MHLRVWDDARVEVSMRRRHGVVIEAVEHVDRYAIRKPRTEVVGHLELVARPAAGTSERRREQHDRMERHMRGALGKHLDDDRSADGMPDDNGSVVQRPQPPPDPRTPPRAARALLSGHPRLANL